MIQGGNRIGTSRNTAVSKMSTVYMRYAMTPLDTSNAAFSKSWHGWGVHSGMWDLGDTGNNKLFTAADGDKIPAGAYLLRV